MSALAARALAALLIVATVFGFGVAAGKRWDAHVVTEQAAEHSKAIAKIERDHATVLAGIAHKTDVARKAYLAYVDFVQDKFIAQAKRYEQEKNDAYELGRRTATAVRAGTLELRHEWAGCPAVTAGPVQAAAAAVAPADPAAEYRAESAGRIIQAAHEHDAWAQSCVSALDAVYGTGQ